MRIKHKYGCMMADGGPVKKKKPMKPPEKGGTPRRITTPGKPGDSGPGGAHPGRNRPKKGEKMADGGKVHGAPMSTPKPGGTTRKRPKVGDKSGDTRLLNPKKRTPSKPAKKPGSKATVFRDYRGTEGAIEDAGG